MDKHKTEKHNMQTIIKWGKNFTTNKTIKYTK